MGYSTLKSTYVNVRLNVYKFLEQPRKYAIWYHMFIFALIVTSFAISVLLTIPQFGDNKDLVNGAANFEIFILTIFIVEFSLRIWSCESDRKFRGCKGKLRFCINFYSIVDFVAIGATLGAVIPYQLKADSEASDNVFELAMLRVTRFVQIFRILRLDRQRGDFKKMGRLIFRHKKELLTSYYIGIMALIFSAFGVYLLEIEVSSDPMIKNLADSLYWAIITVTMVGYGDFSPTTWGSKVICSVFALVGTALFAIPVGIISSGFALEVAKEKRKEAEQRMRTPAAKCIQTWWRACKIKETEFRYKKPSRISQISMEETHLSLNGIHLTPYFVSPNMQIFTGINRNHPSGTTMVDTRTKHWSIFFYACLKEKSTLSKFSRAKKPFLALEDVMAQISSTKLQIVTKLAAAENSMKSQIELNKKIEEVDRRLQAIEQLSEKIVTKYLN